MKKLFRRQAYYIASAAFVILSFVYFVLSINQAYVGLELENDYGRWIVTSSDPHGEAFKLGVRVGDHILKINNYDTGEYRFVKKWSEAEGASSIEFRSLGQPAVNLIKISRSTVFLQLLSEIPMVILGFVFWMLGFITWYKRSFMVQARALFWLNWFIGLAIVLAPASSRDLMFARELEYIVLSSVPMFLIHFVSVFPSENKIRIHRFAWLMLVFMFSIILSFTVLQSVGIVHSISLLRKLVLTTMIIGILFALWNLSALVNSPKDEPEKNQASIILWGMVIGFLPFALLTAVPLIFNSQTLVNPQVSYLFVSAIPATCYYVIVNKYLPDSRRLFRSTLAFIITGIIISLVVTYLLFLFSVVKTLNPEVYLLALFLTLLLMICSSVIRIGLNKLLNRFVFSKGEQNFKRKVHQLNEKLTSIHEGDGILEEVLESLTIDGAFIVIEDDKGGYLKKAAGIFSDKPGKQAELEEFFQADRKINLKTQVLPHDFPAELYIPFASNEFTCGIFLGHRLSHIKFELDELPLITLISSQLAHRLITAFVVKELSEEIKDLAQRSLDSQRRSQGLQGITTFLFSSLEKERKLISREIHDGPLQLGLDLNRWLKFLTEECQDTDKTVKAVSHMRELVEDLNFELRLICNGLRPPALTDLGLLSAIELMCEEIMTKELLLISLETVGINREERFKEEVELAAFRFLQEGITNVLKHSGSNKLKIHIEMNESSIELTVIDSGKGFDTSKIGDWPLTGAHFGIVGMKERLESVGGDLQIISSLGWGTMLIATIPVTRTS